ncbi:hypothetical protein [Streptomyces sp. NPDC001348]
MKHDQTPEDLAARIASLSISAPADHIDVDAAVRAGTRRRRRRHLAVAGVVAGVVAVAGSAAVATQAGHDRSNTMATPRFGSASVTAQDLGGRWTAVRVDGRDVTSWRDAGGIPANLVIGADGAPNGWQVNRACGPLVGGSFTLHADGSFTATLPPPGFQSCPMLSTQPPDLMDAVARTAYVAVAEPADSATRTLRFLDSRRRLVALWREDATIGSGAALCKKVLGRGATSDGTFTTVERIRTKHLAGAETRSEDVLPGVPGGSVAVYCSATEAGSPARYAVTADAHKVRLRSAG